MKKHIIMWAVLAAFLILGIAHSANFYPFSGALTGGGTSALDALTGTVDNDAGIVIMNDDATYGNAFFAFSLDVDGAGSEAPPWLIDSGDGGNEDWELCNVHGMVHYAYGDGSVDQLVINDINAAGASLADKQAFGIRSNMTTTTEDGEISDVELYAQIGGAIIIFHWDGSDESWTMGDSTTGEDLKFDFETATDNNVTVSSNSGVTEISFSAINLLTTGTIAGRVPWGADITGNVSHNTTDLHGKIYLATAAATVTLDAAADAGYGAVVIYRVRDAAETLIIDVDASDIINLDGTALDAGDTIDSPGDAGDYITLIATTDADGLGTDGWMTMGKSGTWTDGGAT